MRTTTRRVLVVDYDNEWPASFEAEAARIAPALGDNLVAIHHIGSTSVPGLRAKPIIDILATVRDIVAVDQCTSTMVALGYEGLGEHGLPGRRYFRKGNPVRAHHVHVFGTGDTDEIERHLAFRDYLRAHADVAREYGALKSRLARRHPEDPIAYMDGKDSFVKSVERDALAWRRARAQ